MSLAIKKVFPKFYLKSKSITNKFPMNVSLWNDQKLKFNYEIYKMFKTWRVSKELREEANSVYNHYDGGDFIDVGSLSGFYSFLLAPKAKRGDHFINCEPDKSKQADLYYNISKLKKIFDHINFSYVS